MAGKKSNQEIGKRGEDLAEEFFRSRGFDVLARNYQTPYGELDLVIKKDGELVFVEVKTRTNLAFGYGETGITEKKAEHLIAAIGDYLEKEDVDISEWRIDVLAILLSQNGTGPEFEWFENAI